LRRLRTDGARVGRATDHNGRSPPQLTIQSEEAAHPGLVKAINEMRSAINTLRAGADDFGGNKAVAINDLVKAIHSVKKALYYRLQMDDVAIDRVQ
jgi:hypothetical protein